MVMKKLEIILFAVFLVFSFLASFDFIVYTLKSAPKISMFSRRFWLFGLISIIGLIYWYVNGMKFL
jgi:hypothetical protein